MARKTNDLRGQAFKDVLGFTFRYWRAQPWRTGLIVALALLSALADVLTPLYAGRLVDAVASGAAADELVWSAALTSFWLLIALGIGSALLRQAVFQNIIVFTLKMMNEMVSNAFYRVQRFSTDWHANSFAGSTVRKITRGMWAVDLLNDTLLVALLPSVVMLVGATALLGAHWPMMGLVVGAGSVLYIAVTTTLSLRYVAPAARLGNAWDTRMGGALADAVSCNAVVKAFGAEEREETRLGRVVDKWRRRTRRTWVRGTLNGGVQAAMLVAMQAGILGVSLLLWSRNQASVGDITFALTMFFMLQGHLRDVGMHIRNLQRSVNDMEELVALEKQPLGVEDRRGAGEIRVTAGEIRFEDVTFRYGAHGTALYDGFSVRIAPGERIGLVGHSGSGKTTFIKLIQRLYDVNGGRITIDGQDIAQAKQASLRSQIAIVQQEPVLFHRTLAENIAYARPGATQGEIEQAARLASAHDFIMALPKGYDTLVGERGTRLSGGERQRISIARAILHNPRILILDEATASVDTQTEGEIQRALLNLVKGRTTFAIAHRLSTLRHADRLVVLDGGRIVEQGTHDELLARRGVFYRLVEAQKKMSQITAVGG